MASSSFSVFRAFVGDFMGFPVYIPVGPIRIHPHWVFESLAYLIGFRVYLWQRRWHGDVVESSQRLWVVTAAIAGAAIGSKLLYWLADPLMTISKWNDPFYLMAGKTIVGGLIGGLIAVELVKRKIGVQTRTGDLFAIPLALAIAIGRIGCFLSGLSDDTYGAGTTLPWGVDFGDGVSRHPVQLYEFFFLLLLALWLRWLAKRDSRNGDVFKAFMVSYLGFRLIVDFIKPEPRLAGLSAIQWACAAMLVYYWRDLPYLIRLKEAPSE